MKLAGIVITKNEERNIERCLKSLQFCDEIIVVDSESEDRTREIASRYTDTVINRQWNGYSDQKNYAISLSKADWIISIDADEEVSPELQKEILSVVKTPNGRAAYSIPRKTIHSGRWIRHGGWYPNRLVRFFKKTSGRWVGDDVHEYWKADGSIGELKGDLVHYSFTSISDQVDRNNHYSTLGAQALQRSGKKFSLIKLLVKPLSKFFETYFLKRGFLDGYPGFMISISAAYSVFLKWAKLWELEKK
jgi:glycosyltransferase involved in cell wall biosynthesis